MNSVIFKEIPVQIGSNKMNINLNDFKSTLSCKDFLDIVLKKCKLNKPTATNTYAVFEYVNGIERLVQQNENILQLWSNWKQTTTHVRFVVRKYRSIERRIVSRKVTSEKTIQMYYKKAKLIAQNVTLIDSPVSKKRRIEPVVKQENKQQQQHHSRNLNILNYLYIKLKQQNYKILVNDENETTITTECEDNNTKNANSSKLNLKSFLEIF